MAKKRKGMDENWSYLHGEIQNHVLQSLYLDFDLDLDIPQKQENILSLQIGFYEL